MRARSLVAWLVCCASAASLATVAMALDPLPRPFADMCTSAPPVFTGDPCSPTFGPYPMLPGLPLVLPFDGLTGRWRSGPPIINNATVGDVDLAVRVGTFLTDPEVPAPAGSAGNPSLVQNVAGGGGSGQGSEIAFTVMVTDGPGSFPYGAVLSGPELDTRPVAVFAFADLDGDGLIGPTDSDTNADNAIERQEAIAHIGRAVGQISGGRFTNSLGVQVAAPASIGGLVVSLASGMYTGTNADALWSDGAPIFTQWPFFPPLDPSQIVYLTEPNPPDSEGPNILFYHPSDFLLPLPNDADLPEAFAVAVDGSNPSTDQFVSISGAAVGVRLMREADPANFTASSRMIARVAPDSSGSLRTLVMPAGEISVTPGDLISLRVLPVDLLGNIADPLPNGLPVKVIAGGGMKILSPNLDNDSTSETMTILEAKGATVTVDTSGVSGSGAVSVIDAPPAAALLRDQAMIFGRRDAPAPLDSDDDGVLDDGDASRTIGDHPCKAADIALSIPCDDNCPSVVNPAQIDTDGDGTGNCCDGTCVVDRNAAGCLECPQSAARFHGLFTRVRSRIKPRAGVSEDSVKLQARLRLGEGQAISPDTESVEISLAEGDRRHYHAQLTAAFVRKGSPAAFVYKDRTGSIGGIVSARIRPVETGLYRMVVVARGVNLVDTQPLEILPHGLVMTATIGDDAWSNRLPCATSPQSLRCAAGK